MLLRAQDARVVRSGAPLLPLLSLEVDARRLALIGDWTGLFQLLEGQAQLLEGELELHGSDARVAIRERRVGLVSARAVFNERWTAAGYLEKVGLLDGMSKKAARRQAGSRLEALGLTGLGSRQWSGLTPVERTAVSRTTVDSSTRLESSV